MKKKSLVLKTICTISLIILGLVWLCFNLASYHEYAESFETIADRISLGEYLTASMASFGISFFASILVIFIGISSLAHVLSLIEFKSPHEITIAALSQYKSLLDAGAITQEEFDVKKKQLLDI